MCGSRASRKPSGMALVPALSSSWAAALSSTPTRMKEKLKSVMASSRGRSGERELRAGEAGEGEGGEDGAVRAAPGEAERREAAARGERCRARDPRHVGGIVGGEPRREQRAGEPGGEGERRLREKHAALESRE